MVISMLVLYAGATAFVESVKKILHPVTPDYTPVTLVIVAVAVNAGKSPMFTLAERRHLIEQCCADLPTVEVVVIEGLLVDSLERYGVQAILRGLRAFSDFEYELQMALMNRNMRPQCETIFLTPTLKNSFVSSSLVKEVASYGGDVRRYVPDPVAEAIIRKNRGEDI